MRFREVGVGVGTRYGVGLRNGMKVGVWEGC